MRACGTATSSGTAKKFNLGQRNIAKESLDLIEKTLRRDRGAARQRGADDIEDMLMARPGGMQKQIQIARQCF